MRKKTYYQRKSYIYIVILSARKGDNKWWLM